MMSAMSDVDVYVSHMERLLDAACAIFPNGDAALPPTVVDRPPEAPLPDAAGGTALGAAHAGQSFDQASARVVALDEALRQTVNDAVAEGRRGAAAAAAIRDGARSDVGAVAPSGQTSDGLGLLVSALDERLAAMQIEISTTRLALQAAAQRLVHTTTELAAVLDETAG